jgi:hypothetical protein
MAPGESLTVALATEMSTEAADHTHHLAQLRGFKRWARVVNPNVKRFGRLLGEHFRGGQLRLYARKVRHVHTSGSSRTQTRSPLPAGLLNSPSGIPEAVNASALCTLGPRSCAALLVTIGPRPRIS